jgi:hypothetical protein
MYTLQKESKLSPLNIGWKEGRGKTNVKYKIIFKDSGLKVLSSEMDPDKIRFETKGLYNERGAEIFRKIRHPPSLEPFKVTAPSYMAVSNSETNCQPLNSKYLPI